jgi:cytochrome c
MIKIIFILSLLLFYTACEDKPTNKSLDGKKLLATKCSSCHDTNMPPIISDDELAPPIMSVSFHVHNFVKPQDESQRTTKAIEFVSDYVFNPSLEKSFCDKESLKKYGLMPSQKDKLTKDEAKAIASYMFKHFTQENLTKIQKEKAEYDALPDGKKVALKNGCLGCHSIDRKRVGPMFKDIANRYKDNKQEIIKSIKNGSKKRWESSNGAVMPSYEKINDKDLQILSEWILKSL